MIFEAFLSSKLPNPPSFRGSCGAVYRLEKWWLCAASMSQIRAGGDSNKEWDKES